MLRQGLWVGVTAAIATLPLSARAELVGLAAVNVAEGATSNALNAPDGSLGNGADEFTTVRASLAGTYRSLRQDQTLSYIYAANFLAEHTEGDSQSHELSWVMNAIPAGRTEIHVQANGTYGTLNSVNPIAAAAALNPQVVAGQLMATPTGPVTFVNAGASAIGSFRPRASLLWRETTTFNEFIPIDHSDAAQTIALAQDFRHEHQWARDAFTLDLSFGYLNAYGFTASTGAVLPQIETVEGQFLAGWRRDLSPDVFASLELGLFGVSSLLTNQFSIGPAARAILHYQHELALADLTLAHTPEASFLIGQTLVSDSATFRALLPIDKKQRFRFVAIGTAQQGSILSGSGLDAAVDLLAVETGVTFQPIGYPFLASLDYSAQDQIGHQTGTAGMTMTFPSLHRQMVMLTLTGTWASNSPWGASKPWGGNNSPTGAGSTSVR